MGYTTNFKGKFTICDTEGKPTKLKKEHKEYLQAFAYTRRMQRDAKKADDLVIDKQRQAVGLPVGPQGAYFVGTHVDGESGQTQDPSITDCNNPPKGQPGLWCHWTPSKDGKYLQWDREEKFYKYIEWLHYIVEHFLNKWGYTLQGPVTWRGKNRSDIGSITCTTVDGETHVEVDHE